MLRIVEPRLELIRKELETFLGLFQFEVQNTPVEVDGFRLRNLTHWRTGKANNAFDALGSLSGSCNARCVFCFERSVPFARDHSILSLAEAKSRLRHFSPRDHRCLFPSARPYMETFLNRKATEVLRLAREQSPDALLIITTNGSRLDQRTVATLATLKPVLLKFSVNSTRPETRRELTGLADLLPPAEVLALLQEHTIPFIGSTVAWPGRPPGELVETVLELARHQPYGIRVRLPLVHRYTPATVTSRELQTLWAETWEAVEAVRKDAAVPLWTEPVQYRRTPLLPIVDGVIANSPARAAGIRAGDLVRSLNGQPVASRAAIRRLFQGDRLAGSRLQVEVESDGETRSVQLAADDSPAAGFGYPYHPDLGHPGERFGLLFLPDVDLEHLRAIARLIHKHNARRTLLLCSEPAARLMETLLADQELFHDREFWIYPLTTNLMAGNTSITESRFVVDYETAFCKACAEIGQRPDLLLVPDVFGSAWGIDFHGRSIVEVQYTTGIPVELVPWQTIYGRED